MLKSSVVGFSLVARAHLPSKTARQHTAGNALVTIGSAEKMSITLLLY